MNKIISGIIGSIMLLSLMSGTVMLSSTEVDSTYYCISKDIVVLANSLSTTQRRAYWFEGTTKRYKDCSEGWVKLRDYAKQQGLNIGDVINNSKNIAPISIISKGCREGQTCSVCSVSGCEVIN